MRVPYYSEDLKKDPNLENYPFRLSGFRFLVLAPTRTQEQRLPQVGSPRVWSYPNRLYGSSCLGLP